MKIRTVLYFLFLNFIVSLSAYAEEFKVNNIKVLGLQRVDEGVVLSALSIEPGDVFDTNDSSAYIKTIYKTGYFKSITINKKLNDLVVYVKEKPAIAKIKIIGNDSFDTEQLNKALGNIGIKEGGTYDEFTLERLRQELEQQYLSQGKYSVRVKSEVKALERNRVAITINISEGKVAKIKQIRIIGNKSFSKQELVEDFSLSEGGVLSWFTFSDRYSKQKLAGDLEKLKSFYLDRGYLNFTIEDAQLSITPDKQQVYIVIQINEGQVYKVSDVNIGGRTTQLGNDVDKFIDINKGDTYSARKISNTENNLLNELGRNGYLFAKVNIDKKVNASNNTVNITFFVTPGKRVYVRRISFSGNLKTQDEVLRREVLQMEGGYISRENIELSKQRLAGLGYVKDINVETIPVAGSYDQVDLKYTLTEMSSGHFTGGVGYVENEGFMFNLGISQENFFGTGKSVSTNFNRSSAATNLGVSYFDPYFTIDGIGLGYNVYYSKTNLKELAISNYRLDNYGIDARLNIPLSLFDSLSFNLGAHNKNIKYSNNSVNVPYHVRIFTNRNGRSHDQFPIGAVWQHVELDRALFPTKGWKTQFGGNIMIPGSSLTYYVLSNSTKVYIPIYDEFILHLKAKVAYGSGYNKNTLPFFDNYYAGGIGTVRGFVQNSLGPRDSNNDPMGGNALTAGTAELYIPRLFATNIAWRPSLFIDTGNVYKNIIHLKKLRVSAGVGLQWLSPMGPLSVSYALPIKKFKNDDLKGFNFNVGSVF